MFNSLRPSSRPARRLLSLALAGTAIAGSVAMGGSPASAQSGQDHDPVLFVHGFTRSSADFAAYKEKFIQTGWSADRLFTIDYTLFTPNEAVGVQIAAKVAEIRATTGAAKVDIVAHSMGAYGSRYFLKNLGGAAVVDTFVSVSGPNHGTSTATVASCVLPFNGFFIPLVSCQQMVPGSAFLTDLNSGDETPGDVNYVTLRTPGDDLVVPSSSTELDGAKNHVSDQIVSHMEYAVTDEAINLSRNAVR
jgi:triacylglycerol lipase